MPWVTETVPTLGSFQSAEAVAYSSQSLLGQVGKGRELVEIQPHSSAMGSKLVTDSTDQEGKPPSRAKGTVMA